MQIKGHLPALITPFKPTGEVDLQTLEQLVQWHLSMNVDGLVVLGTTAETPTLTSIERQAILDLVVGITANQVPIIVGTGCNNTHATVERCRWAMTRGADACLVVTTYYNRPTQKGLLAHYQRVLSESDSPIMLYNVPARTQVDLDDDVVEKLFSFEQCIGIKAADGDVTRLSNYLRFSKGKSLLSGDDATIKPWVESGGDGIISVLGNLMPKSMTKAVTSGLKQRDFDFQDYQMMIKELAWSVNPVPIKYALAAVRRIPDSFVRLPLVNEIPGNTQSMKTLFEYYQQVELKS